MVVCVSVCVCVCVCVCVGGTLMFSGFLLGRVVLKINCMWHWDLLLGHWEN